METKPLIREKIAGKLRQYVNQIRSNTQVRIPSERELSDYFGVSRITLRAAIRQLVGEGILVQLKGKGTYITPRNEIRQLHLICSPRIKNNDPFYIKFLSELTAMASKQSMNILLIGPDQIEKAAPEVPLIIIGLMEDNTILNQLISCYRSIIAIQDYNNYNDVISQIYFNDYKIGWQAAHLLTTYGHRNILLLAGPEKYPSANYRKKGFTDAMDSLGSTPHIYIEKMNWAGGYHSGEYILTQFSPENRPSAVFATNDWMAVGLMQKLKENGIRIPEDISIVGCDDIPLAGEFVPALTTYNLDTKQLIMELFSLLNELQAAEGDKTRKVVLPATLVMRDTLKKVN